MATGIMSYGGYIPRLRLNRMSIYQSMGWFAPAIVMVAQGERSFCNWDEDSLTMAVAAARDCLAGMDKRAVDGHLSVLHHASVSGPALTRASSRQPSTCETTSWPRTSRPRLRSGTTGLDDGARRGDRAATASRCSSPPRTSGRPRRPTSTRCGSATAPHRSWLGDRDVIAEYLGGHTVSYDFVDHYRGAEKQYDYMWEERWVRDEGIRKDHPGGREWAFRASSPSPWTTWTRWFSPVSSRPSTGTSRRSWARAPRRSWTTSTRSAARQARRTRWSCSSHALEKANPGDRILLAGFGQGCDALYFRVTENIRKLPPRKGIRG